MSPGNHKSKKDWEILEMVPHQNQVLYHLFLTLLLLLLLLLPPSPPLLLLLIIIILLLLPLPIILLALTTPL